MAFVNISVIIPTYNRVDKLQVSLRRILACDPSPGEVIVHVDGGDTQTAVFVRSKFPEVRLIESAIRSGPGGGRNQLMAAASYPIVASFDDDSYPLDTDYFARLGMIFDEFPSVAVLGAAIFHQGEEIKPTDLSCRWVADFVGCGCAYRREAFLFTTGFVPLPIAYGMEEVDLAIRLHGSGRSILETRWLRVMHLTTRQHHLAPTITAAAVANLCLLTYLRYPITCWGIGFVQVVNRIWWLLRSKRWQGILAGLVQAPRLIRRYAVYRGTVSASALHSYLRLRRQTIDVGIFKPGLAAFAAPRRSEKHVS
jgi:glycosyltransferase involved in cell wall biosynthesis